MFEEQNIIAFKEIDDPQKAFILAKEIAYNYLKSDRYWLSADKIENFDQVCIILCFLFCRSFVTKTIGCWKINDFLTNEKLNPEEFVALIESFQFLRNLYQRLANLLKDFHLKNLFF